MFMWFCSTFFLTIIFLCNEMIIKLFLVQSHLPFIPDHYTGFTYLSNKSLILHLTDSSTFISSVACLLLLLVVPFLKE